MFDSEQVILIYAGLLALSLLLYALLDGYDLGVGMLMPLKDQQQSDTMIASIGPFWDANETWLVLAVGLLLIVFPSAHNLILGALYIPMSLMLIGLILRGVAFDFRAKVKPENKGLWDKLFKAGSILTAFTQGFMLGMYIMQFQYTPTSIGFSILSGLGVCAAYCLIGACWLIMKTEGALQAKAKLWAKNCGRITFFAILSVCSINPIINPAVMKVWFTLPQAIYLLNLPLFCFCLLALNHWLLSLSIKKSTVPCWLNFAITIAIFICCFLGLLISFYPFIVPNTLTIWQSAAATESLQFLLYGALVVIPCIFMYTVFSYRVFWGKVRPLEYY